MIGIVIVIKEKVISNRGIQRCDDSKASNGRSRGFSLNMQINAGTTVARSNQRSGSIIQIPMCDEPWITGKICDAIVANVVTVGLIQHAIKPANIVHETGKEASSITGVASHIHQAADGFREIVDIKSGQIFIEACQISHFGTIQINPHFAGVCIPRVLDVGPNALNTCRTAILNREIGTILSSSKELSTAVITILEFQSAITGAFKELISFSCISHVDPEV
ncbi:hypothetical protein V202x_23760 [Gimesia aquarii]|uniref:Uncharacterized protein n=1 Tax=Gimesia aquarii TaxID=2527964 RepID=A0A517WUS8_9PLAN|nr:hypothetical protein V202x_23760 [Gimesia aquarii]